MKELTKAEEVVMLAIWRLKENAYGVTIREQVKKITRRLYVYGTLYSTLEQLVHKGYLRKKMGEPTAERGGKRKVFFSLTKEGLLALKNAFAVTQTAWSGITDAEIDKAISDEK